MIEFASLQELKLFNFDVNDMDGCDCAVAIVKALMAVDDAASIYVDMETRGVEVTSATAGSAQFLDAIVAAGFTPVLLHEAQPVLMRRKTPPRNLSPAARGEFRSG
jgi:copper chaperone CopZ